MEPIKDSGLHAWDEIEVKGPMSNYYPTSKRGGETKKKKKRVPLDSREWALAAV